VVSGVRCEAVDVAKEQVVEGREAEGRDGMIGRRGRKRRRAASLATRQRSIGPLDGCVCAVCVCVRPSGLKSAFCAILPEAICGSGQKGLGVGIKAIALGVRKGSGGCDCARKGLALGSKGLSGWDCAQKRLRLGMKANALGVKRARRL